MAENVMRLIEEKINSIPDEASEVTGEHVVAALEAIRAAMNQDGAFVIPVEITAGGFPRNRSRKHQTRRYHYTGRGCAYETPLHSAGRRSLRP